jgi:hypothetical protein
MGKDRCDPGKARPANAHPAPEELARYVDCLGAGPKAPLPPELIAHVENCDACQGQILDVLFYLHDPLGQAEFPGIVRPLSRPGERPAWLFPAARIAAAAFIFLMLAAIHLHLPRLRYAIPRETTASTAPLERIAPPARPQPAGREERAPARLRDNGGGRASAPPGARLPAKREAPDAFSVNPNLESMVGSRSRGLAIEVYSPPNEAALAGETVFSWKEFQREPLTLVIVNNRNDTVFRTTVSGASFVFRGGLGPGCYYWKLESPNELYYVGKFLVPAGPTSPGG